MILTRAPSHMSSATYTCRPRERATPTASSAVTSTTDLSPPVPPPSCHEKNTDRTCAAVAMSQQQRYHAEKQKTADCCTLPHLQEQNKSRYQTCTAIKLMANTNSVQVVLLSVLAVLMMADSVKQVDSEDNPGSHIAQDTKYRRTTPCNTLNHASKDTKLALHAHTHRKHESGTKRP